MKNAYYTFRLSAESQKYCGITPYYGSETYLYQRLGMGLSVSPGICWTFTNKVLNEIPDRKDFLSIMDDYMIHSKRKVFESLDSIAKSINQEWIKDISEKI